MAGRQYIEQGRGSELRAGTAILSESLRRDLVDLNYRYLELGVELNRHSDPLTGWAASVRGAIEGAEPIVLKRMAACPFAMFQVSVTPCSGRSRERVRVEDRPLTGEGIDACARLASFRHVALFTAWRLADNTPLAARIAFGLLPEAELKLNEMCPTEVAWLAEQPGSVRARWPEEDRFWTILRSAAQLGGPNSLQWAHCYGICLMAAEHGPPSAATASRSARPGR